MKHARAEAGNMFFIILLGVALFAAFSYAVTQSNQKGGNGNPDQIKLDASQIIAYGNTLKSAVDLLRQQGISESDISFANNTISGYGTVGAAPSKEIFHIQGGGVTYEAPLSRWLDPLYSAQGTYGQWVFAGTNGVNEVGTPENTYCGDDTCADLVAILSYVRKATCQQINASLGLTAATANPPQNDDTLIRMTKFNGVYSQVGTIGDDINVGILNGRLSGCVESHGTPAIGTYVYYQVLIAR